jgi:predicted glycosyltransferase
MRGVIWFDLANSPHVMFFRPVISSIEDFDILITARDFSETVDLLRSFGMEFVLVGKHGGKGKLGKVRSMVERVWKLGEILKGKRVALAVSHNSYDQIVASKIYRIRNITFMDYDKQIANHLAFRLSDLVVVQEWFPQEALRYFGARRVKRYRGLKEEMYLLDFKPDPEVPRIFNIKRPLVFSRPPSTLSLYQKGYGIFWETLVYLKNKGADVRVLPRNPEDEKICKDLGIESLKKPVPAPQLIFWADIFVGGGGTMTREAVILGTPAYSVLPQPGYLDKKLSEMGLLKFVEDPKEIRLEGKDKFEMRSFNPNIREDILNIILEGIEG